MSLLKEIHANAAVAWSPVKRRAELLALGSKGDGGVGFEHSGGEFKLVSMDFSDPLTNMVTLGSIKTPSRFTSLAWRDITRHHDTLPYGLVAGGMADGSVSLWNPKALIDQHGGATPTEVSPEIGRIMRHKGAVNALQFNPHEDSSHLLASGGSDGEVYIMSLEKLSSPGVFTPGGPTAPQQQINEITSVAWNTQVNYILATGSQNGSVVIWDLKQKKPWCELRDPQRGTISAIAWNPNEGLQIATASGDDQRPVVKLWDLRNSTSTPLAEFHEHTAGVLSLSWCPNDPGLILSCGKDNKTLLWDLFSRKSLYEFPSENTSPPGLGSDQFFGGGAGQRRWNVQWSPKIPAVASTCTLDGKVQVWGLSGGGNPACRPPKWTRRPAGASFGFGGKLVTISNPKEAAGPNQDRRKLVHFHRIISEAPLVAEAEELDRSLESKDFKGHCERKIAGAATENEKSVWSFMKILFEQDARQHLLLHLGLDAEKINELNAKFNPQAAQEAAAASQALLDPTAALLNQRIDGIGAEDVFSSDYHGNGGVNVPASPLSDVSSIAAALPAADDTSKRLDVVPAPIYTEQSESILMQALLVGNFEVAVNSCLHYNQFADALLLASCGGPELWDKTQRAFFAHQTRPVMRVVSAIIKNELHSLVEQSDLKEWRETLAILSTYAKSEEFPSLCDKLATRLEAAGDLHSATLCFMCAVNVEKTVNAWVKESEVESRAHGHTFALQRLVEKVSIFSQAVDQNDQSMGEEVAMRFAEYASLMAAQGRLDIAAKYARFPDLSCAILKDRIFHAAPIPGYQPPPFPFDMVQVHAYVPQQQQVQQHPQAVQQQQAQGYGNRAQYGVQTPVPAAVGYGAPQATPGYQQQPRAPSPGYPGRQPQPGYQTPQQPAYQAPQQPQYAAPQQPGYGAQPQAAYPGQAAPSPYPGQQQPGYQNQPPAFPGAPQQPQQAGYPSQAQPGFGRPQQPAFPGHSAPQNFSGPPSTGAPNLAGYGAPQQPGVGFNANPAAVPQGTGVNPLTAATSFASSKISKPSVDMSSQKKDGFVSSVGNKELTLKYGNATNAILSPGAAQPQKTFSAETASGSTENVQAQDLSIVNTFNDLFAQLQTLPLTMMEQKQMPEIQKAKDVMFTKLNIGDLSPNVVAQLHQMVACFAQRDFASAQGIYVALTASDWTQHKDWLPTDDGHNDSTSRDVVPAHGGGRAAVPHLLLLRTARGVSGGRRAAGLPPAAAARATQFRSRGAGTERRRVPAAEDDARRPAPHPKAHVGEEEKAAATVPEEAGILMCGCLGNALSSEKKSSRRDPGHVDLTRTASRTPSSASKPTSKDRLASLRASEFSTSGYATAPSGSQESRLRYSWMRENEQKEESTSAAEASLPASKLQPPRSSFFSAASSVADAKEQRASGVDTGSTATFKRSFSERHYGGNALQTTETSSSKMSDTQKRQVQREERRYSWQKDKATSASGNAPPASQHAVPALTTHSVVSQANSSKVSTSTSLSSSSSRTFNSASLSFKPSLHDRKQVSLPQKQSTTEMNGNSARVTESLDFRSRYVAHHYDQEEEEKGNTSPLATESPRHRSLSSFAPSPQNGVFDDSDEEFLSVIRRPARNSPIRSFSTSTDRTHSSFASDEMDVERTIAAAFGGRPLARAVSTSATMPVQYHQPAPPVVAAPVVHHSSIAQEQSQAHAISQQQQQQSQQQRSELKRRQRESTVKQILERERTPKIIRRIAFDEEMMALSATPVARTPAAGSSTGKRKRSKIFSPDDETPDFTRRRTRL